MKCDAVVCEQKLSGGQLLGFQFLIQRIIAEKYLNFCQSSYLKPGEQSKEAEQLLFSVD